jgi:hypothetical protein
MRSRTLGWGLSVCVALSVLGYGAANAQNRDRPPPVEGVTPSPPETSIGLQREVKLTPDDELKHADTYVARIAVIGSSVRRMLEQARAQRDVVKTLCLNDKLNQIDVAQRSADDRRSALQQAAQRSDSDLANHEFTILTVLRQRVEQLGAESNQCVGEELTLIGESKVTTVVDPNMPNDDSTAYPVNPVVGLPPVVALPPVPVSGVK